MGNKHTEKEVTKKQSKACLFDNPIDREECRHFYEEKQWLQEGINSASKTNMLATKTRKRYNGNDKNDIPPIQEANGYREVSQEDISLYQRRLAEPYFAHVEYREIFQNGDTEIQSAYIGQEMIAEGSNIHVHSWESDIANELLYDKRTISYEKKLKARYPGLDDSETYTVHPDLRRMILSEKGDYIKSVNEYVSDEYISRYGYAKWIEAGEQISDEFLLDILKEKKDEKHISNIIRTIQQDQNRVIRLPLQESFIVEGCAGSGKTMIMLHRLSFLSRRKFISDDSKVLILTPSEDFNAQIHALMQDLGIEKMNISNVEQYYNTLLKEINWDEVNRSKMRDENMLPHEFLREMYSGKMLERMQQEYELSVEKSIQGQHSISQQTIELYAKQLNIETKIINYKKIEDLIVVLESILLQQQSLKKQIEEKNGIMEKMQQTINRAYAEKYTLEINIETQKTKAAAYLAKLHKTIESSYEKAKTEEKKIQFRNLLDTISVVQLDLLLADTEYRKAITNCAVQVNLNSELQDVLKKYDKAQQQLKSNEVKIENNTKYIAEQQQFIAEAYTKLLLSDEEEEIQKYFLELKDNKTRTLGYQGTFNERIKPLVEERCKVYGIGFHQNYKFYLYLKLWWYYYTSGNLRDDYLVCIDEAQNLSATEYQLLYRLHGKQTVFNLYGDLLQNTRGDLGILHWSDVQKAIFKGNAAKVYTFAENYRNTNQITAYVNEKLKLEKPMKMIGYDGPSVDAGKYTINLLLIAASYEEGKTAVIVSEITNEIRKIARSKNFSVGKVLDTGVSVLSINDVKGLEFNTVFVMDKGLSYNEKYIAYTRALYQLHIATE